MANTARVTQSFILGGTLQTGNARATQSYVIVAATLGLSCGSPPAGVIGTAYSHTFPSGGGIGAVAFSISAGALPGGLTLNTATGVVSGTPVAPAGVSPFSVQALDSAGAIATVACSITIAAAPPAPPPPVVMPGQGGGQPYMERSRGGCGFNLFDYCTLIEMERWKMIRPLPVCSVPLQYQHILPWEDDFAAIPAQARPFRAALGIVTPVPAVGDQTVVSVRTPLGYDGVVTGLFWGYSGQGFLEGSGDILWRLKINQRYVKDLSNTPFQLGSPRLPLPMTEVQQLQSGQVASVIVNVPNLSGLIQVGQSRIFAALIGFWWPRAGAMAGG